MGRDEDGAEVDASAKDNFEKRDAIAWAEPGESASTPRKARTGTTFFGLSSLGKAGDPGLRPTV